MALIILRENLNNALDKGQCSIGIFLDFQKAFDTVNHGILLDKLYHYGIRCPAYEGFSSYLNERYQFVVCIMAVNLNISIYNVESLKGQYLGHCFFLFILMICHLFLICLCYIVCRWYQLILYWSIYWFSSQGNKCWNVKSVFLGES